MRFILDTNIWIAMLRNQKLVIGNFRKNLAGGHEILVTPVEYFELLRGLEKRGHREHLERIKNLWLTLTYCEADRRMWDTAIKLWISSVKRNQKREDADVILAAFVARYDAVLVTNNVHDFEGFDFPIEDWSAPASPQ